VLKAEVSRPIYVPSGVSSFFEICDSNPDGSKIKDALKIGARGGGFKIKKGTVTIASANNSAQSDTVVINGRPVSKARVTSKVLELMRTKFGFGAVRIEHRVEPPIGAGFGTSGAGALGTAISVSDLFDLNLTLAQASAFAHIAEVESQTGLGTVISIASGCGAIGLVTEPGCFSVGRVDALLEDANDFTLICVYFGPVEKATVINNAKKREMVNKYGKNTLKAVLRERTAESLLTHSRLFAENTGLASKKLLELTDKTKQLGAVGSTQNMIGNAVHCLVPKAKRKSFLNSLTKLVGKDKIFESELCQSGPTFLRDRWPR
jgi:pantoate kinase